MATATEKSALGLEADATDEQVQAAIAQLKQQASDAQSNAEQARKEADEAKTEADQLREQANEPADEKVQPGTAELGALELPATSPHRVVAVGATYLDATETIGNDGKPTIVYLQKLGYRHEIIDLNAQQARRLIELGAVKPEDAPRTYDEMYDDELKDLAADRGIAVASTGADPDQPLRTDYVNALLTYDQGAQRSDVTDSGAAVAASAPGGVTVSDARDQSGRRA